MIYLVCVLAYFEALAWSVDQMAISYGAQGVSALLLHQVAFLTFDCLAILLIELRPIGKLTSIITLILSISVINHALGGIAYVVDNESLLSTYDACKGYIFNLELLAIITYGVSGGIKRILGVPSASRVHSLEGFRGRLSHCADIQTAAGHK